MRNIKTILGLLLLAAGIVVGSGCLTEDFNLRAIRDDRTYVSADSTQYGMKWRTASWANANAKYWSSASLIITPTENVLGSSNAKYWIKKVVDKGFKGVIAIDEDFSILPLSYGTEPLGFYKRDLYDYFLGLDVYTWQVVDANDEVVTIDHPTLGECYLLNPATMEADWGVGAYNILKSNMASITSWVGGRPEDFQLVLFQAYRTGQWEAHVDHHSLVELAAADPLNKGYGIAQYTPTDMGGFSTLSDARIAFLKTKGIPVIIEGNRLDTTQARLIDRSIIGVFTEDMTNDNKAAVLAKVAVYRGSYTPTSDEDALMIVGAVKNDVYHGEGQTPTKYAQLIKSLIDNGMYFTPGANNSYFEMPKYNPGDWWVRKNDDRNWQNNRNNPTYESVVVGPRRLFNITPPAPEDDGESPAAPTSVTATGAHESVLIDWASNTEPDMAYYTIYMSIDNFSNSSILATDIVASQYTDVILPANIGVTYYYRINATDTSGNTSDYSSIVSAAATDEVPPAIPTGFTASNPTYESDGGDFDTWLSWTPVSDAVSYKIYAMEPETAEFVYIGVPSTVSFVHFTSTYSGTDPSMWAFKISSVDEYDNESEQSAAIYWTTQNYLSPGTPLSFSVTASERSVTVNWICPNYTGWGVAPVLPPADFVGFLVYKGTSENAMVEVATVPWAGSEALTSIYQDRFMEPGVLQYYKVSSIDTWGNESPVTTTLSATPYDITGPSAPTSVSIEVGDDQLSLLWVNSTAEDLDHVNVYRGTSTGFTVNAGSKIGESTTNGYVDQTAVNETTYYYKLKSVDIYGNIGTETSTEVSETPVDTTPIPDTLSPPIPTNLTATQNLGPSIDLSWTASVDVAAPGSTASGTDHYNVYRGSSSVLLTLLDTTSSTTYSDEDLGASRPVTFYYAITAVDVAGNESVRTSVSTGIALDTGLPSTVTGVSVAQMVDNQVMVFWTTSSDPDVHAYNIYRATTSNGQTTVTFSNVTGNVFFDNTVVNGTTYYYKLKAVDDSGNLSAALSSEASIAVVDKTLPIAPTLTGVSGDDFVSLSWTASTDPGTNPSGIASYRVYRSTDPINTGIMAYATGILTRSYTDNVVDNKTTYYYQIAAVDNAGNISAKSLPIISVTPDDITPPSPPTGLVAVYGDQLIDLSWNANPVGDDVTRYDVLVGINGGAIVFLYNNGTNTTYRHASLTNGTTYSYQIIAYDDATPPNPSARSTVVSAVPNTVIPPTAPTGVDVVTVDGTWAIGSSTVTTEPTVTITWDANPVEDGVDIYTVFRSYTPNMDMSNWSNIGSVASGSTLSISDYPYNASTRPTGFINGSPQYYKVVAINNTGVMLASDLSDAAMVTPRVVRSLPTPFYFANWMVDPLDQPLTNQQVTDLAAYDGVFANTFSFEPRASEPAYNTNANGTAGSLLTRLRAINPDLVYFTYVGINSTRKDWDALPATYDNTPYKQVAAWARDPDGNGTIDNGGYMKYASSFTHAHLAVQESDGIARNVSHVAGDKMQGGGYPVFVLNWARDADNDGVSDLANKLAEIYVAAYASSNVSGEYTGLMLDFLNTDHQDWICDGGCNAYMDADGDLIPYGEVGSVERLQYNDLYNGFCEDVLAAFRREFAKNNLKNRLIVVNGNRGLYNAVKGTSDVTILPSETSKWLDGWYFEQWNCASGIPGWRVPTGFGQSEGWAEIGTRTAEFNEAQISPRAFMFEAVTDSNMQYMNEPVALAFNGWVQENQGIPSSTATSGERGAMARGETNQIPTRIGNRLPNPGTLNSVSYIQRTGSTHPVWGSAGDTLVVDYTNYDLKLALEPITWNGSSTTGSVGATGRTVSPWSYYVEAVNESTGQAGVVLRRAGDRGVSGSVYPAWPAPIPSTPTGLAAAPVTNESVTGSYIDLSWTANPNPSRILYYKIYRKLSSSGSETQFLATSATNSYRDDSAVYEVEYTYQVSAIGDRSTLPESAKSTAISNKKVTDSTAPDQVTGLAATPGDGYVSLDWADVSGDRVTYRVLSTPEGGSGTLVTGLTNSTYTVSNLTNGVEHTFLVYAQDIHENSSTAASVLSTPVGVGGTLEFTSGPTINSVSATAQNLIQFNWTGVLATNAQSRAIYYRDSESVPDSTGAVYSAAARDLDYTVTSSIVSPTRDTNQSVSLVWSQTSNPSHYHIERKIDNGSWVSLTTSVDGALKTYTDASAPRAKIEYRIAAVSGAHGGGETVGGWVYLSEVNNVADTAVYNEALELHLTVDITEDGDPVVRENATPVVFDAPVPVPATEFTASPLTGPYPLTVTFTNTTTYDADGGVPSWYWDFGDGAQQQSPINTPVSTVATHTYSSIGVYTPFLRATNSSGATTRTRSNYINVTDQSQRVTSGLVALYEFNEGTGSTIHDTSGFGVPLDLTVNQQSTTTSWVTGGISLNLATNISSVAAATKINDAIMSSNAYTIELWVKPTDTLQPRISGQGPARIFTLADATSNNALVGHGAQLGGTSNVISVRNTMDANETQSSGVMVGGEIIHIAWVRNSSGAATLYVNGSQNLTTTQSAQPSANWVNTRVLLLGNGITSRPWYGTYYLVAVYNRALSSGEILQNYGASTTNQIERPPFVTTRSIEIQGE